MLAEAAETKKTVDPGGVIAGAVAQDGVGREIVAQPHHHRAEIHFARLFGRLVGPGQIIGMCRLGLARRSASEFERFEHGGEGGRRGVDR